MLTTRRRHGKVRAMGEPVRLTKNHRRITLSKPRLVRGVFRIRLIWEYSLYDADLILLYRTKDGRKGVIQALGGSFGSRCATPFIQLLGDDRVGGHGETMLGDVDGVFGDLEWFGLGGSLYGSDAPLRRVKGAKTYIELPGHEPIEVEHSGGRTNTCAILSVDVDDEGLHVTRHMRSLWSWGFRSAQVRLDKFWGVGLDWTLGRK